MPVSFIRNTSLKPVPAILIVSAAVVALGAAFWLNAREPKRVWPKPTPPPPASPIYQDVDEPMPSEEDIAREASERPARLEQEIEAAARSPDTLRRETAFVFLLPELLQVEPKRVLDLIERQEPGPVRDLLRTELAEYWISRDPPAAVAWIKTLNDEERRAAGTAAMRVLRPINPEQARVLAQELELPAGPRPGIVQADSPD